MTKKNNSKKKIFLNGFKLHHKENLYKKFGRSNFISSKLNLNKATALISYDRKSFEELMIYDVLSKKNNLDWMLLPGVGVENYIKFSKFKNITFTNMREINSNQVADHAFALLLSITRKLHFLNNKGLNAKFDFRPIELKNKRAVILGYGGVGQKIAIRAKSFGLNVDVITNKSIYNKSEFNIYFFKNFYQIISKANIIFISAPLTKATKNLFNYKTFKLMKKKSIIINVSRGEIISTEDLVTALKEKIILAAGLDVTYPEKLPTNHDLFKINNVIITPHIASISSKFHSNNLNLIKKNIYRYLNGFDLINSVNLKDGY